MAIPAILPYSMPAAKDFPKNKVAWIPDSKRAVLLVHDMQQYFLNAFTAGESPLRELMTNIRLLLNQCDALGIPVVYSAQPGGQSARQRGLLQDFWGSGLRDHSDETKITDELAPDEGHIMLTKWRYSAFQKTPLRELLKEQGRDQLIICGVYAHIGCLMTACDAFMQEVEPFLAADAVADFSLDNHRMALSYVAERCGAVLSTEQLITSLKGMPEGFASMMQDDGQTLTRQLVYEQVAELLQEPVQNIGEEDDLVDWGLDSVRIMNLVERWRRGGAEVTFVELAECPTLAGWWTLLSGRLRQALPNEDYFAS